MSLKTKLCEIFDEKVNTEGMSYTEIVNKSKLTRSQVYKILKEEGESISSDRIWEGLGNLGVEVEIKAFHKREND